MYLLLSGLRSLMYMHTMAGICTGELNMYLHFIGLYQGDEHEFAFLAFMRAQNLSLHLLVCMES